MTKAESDRLPATVDDPTGMCGARGSSPQMSVLGRKRPLESVALPVRLPPNSGVQPTPKKPRAADAER